MFYVKCCRCNVSVLKANAKREFSCEYFLCGCAQGFHDKCLTVRDKERKVIKVQLDETPGVCFVVVGVVCGKCCSSVGYCIKSSNCVSIEGFPYLFFSKEVCFEECYDSVEYEYNRFDVDNIARCQIELSHELEKIHSIKKIWLDVEAKRVRHEINLLKILDKDFDEGSYTAELDKYNPIVENKNNYPVKQNESPKISDKSEISIPSLVAVKKQADRNILLKRKNPKGRKKNN